MKDLVKMLFLAIWAVAAIMTSVLAFNFDAFYIICGIINLATNAFGLYHVGRKLLGSND